MNKKIIVISIILMMALASSPAYAILLNNNEENQTREEHFNDKTQNSEDIDFVLTKPKGRIIQDDNDSENFTDLKMGWLKVQTKGKGFKIFLPVNVLKLSHSFSTLQYPNFNPFLIQYWLCYTVYNDSNATTKITDLNGNITWINGTHSLITGIFFSPSMAALGMLLNDGLFDGFGGFQIQNTINSAFSLINGFLNTNLTNPLGYFQRLVNKMVPGAPFFDFNNFYNFSSFFQTWPLYFPSNFDPLFNTPFLSKIQKMAINIKFLNNFGFNKIGDVSPILSKLVIFALGSIIFQYSIVNKFTPFFCPLISFIDPYGWDFTPGPFYTPLIRYSKNPNPSILNGVKSIQGGIQKGMVFVDSGLEWIYNTSGLSFLDN